METDWGKWGCIAIGVAFLLLCGYGLLSSKPIGHGYFQVELAEPPAHFLQEPEGLRPIAHRCCALVVFSAPCRDRTYMVGCWVIVGCGVAR